MSNADKNINLVPNIYSTDTPYINFVGSNNTPTLLRVLDDGTLSFQATAGQLLAISDGATGTIFSVNDITGLPLVQISADGRVKISAGGVLEAPVVQNAQTSTSYTTVLLDAGKMIEANNTSAITITVPLNSSVAYPLGTQINILQTNTGQVTIAGASGVTVNGTPGLKLRTQWSFATLIKRATDTWVLVGDLSA